MLLLQQAAGPWLDPGAFALDLLRTLAALAGVCVLAFLSLRWLSRRGFGGFGARSGAAGLRVLQRLPLDARRTLYVVAAGKRVLLIGAGDGGAPALIAELDADALAQGEAATGKDADVAAPLASTGEGHDA